MIAMIIKPGVGLNMMNITANTTVTTNVTMIDTILNIIPDNPINSLANGDMLPVIIYRSTLWVNTGQIKG